MNDFKIFGEIPKDKFKYLENFFVFILGLFDSDHITDKDLEIAQLMLVLSKTIYYAKGIINKQKIYLIENLKKTILKKNKFWIRFLQYIIYEEINKVNFKGYINLIDFETNTAYTQMLVVVSEMKDLGFEKDEVKILMNDSFEKYHIPEELQNKVNSFIEEQMGKKIK